MTKAGRSRSRATRPSEFPWREGNRCTLIQDGVQFFPAMLQAINQAHRHILFEMYLFASGEIAERFITAFSAAARRGVHVYMLLDDYGSWGLQPADRERLLHCGVDLVFYNPLRYTKLARNLFRDHRKILVVDGSIAFLGGAGITDEFAPKRNPEHAWRETMVAVQGPCVADWQTVFARNWRRWARRALVLDDVNDQHAVTGQWGRVVVAEASGVQKITQSLLKRVRRAEHRVWLATAYFVPSWKIRRALRQAALRGVDVRVLLPGPCTDHPAIRHAGRRFYHRLLRNGVRIFEYQPRFTHSKVLLCDAWVSIGSSNMDRWNFTWNLEANQEVDGEALAGEVATMFARDFGESHEIIYDEWIRRPWRRRILEWFWGRIDTWLAHYSRARRLTMPRAKDKL